jgi:hypothetical protein
MTMITLLFYRRLIDAAVSPLIRLATWLLARSLDMPESLLHTTGSFLFARLAWRIVSAAGSARSTSRRGMDGASIAFLFSGAAAA